MGKIKVEARGEIISLTIPLGDHEYFLFRHDNTDSHRTGEGQARRLREALNNLAPGNVEFPSGVGSRAWCTCGSTKREVNGVWKCDHCDAQLPNADSTVNTFMRDYLNQFRFPPYNPAPSYSVGRIGTVDWVHDLVTYRRVEAVWDVLNPMKTADELAREIVDNVRAMSGMYNKPDMIPHLCELSEKYRAALEREGNR